MTTQDNNTQLKKMLSRIKKDYPILFNPQNSDENTEDNSENPRLNSLLQGSVGHNLERDKDTI